MSVISVLNSFCYGQALKTRVSFGAFQLGLKFLTRTAISQLSELTWYIDVRKSGNFQKLNEMRMGRDGHSLSEQSNNKHMPFRDVSKAPAEREEEMLDPVRTE